MPTSNILVPPNLNLPAQIKLWKNQKIRKICSKLTTETPDRGHCRRSGVFIANLEQISEILSKSNSWL